MVTNAGPNVDVSSCRIEVSCLLPKRRCNEDMISMIRFMFSIMDFWQNESSILDISILGRLRLNEYLFICPLYWTFAKKSLTIEVSVLHQELN
jgi:hypothetical protein